jgi:ankyrin repeat protein
VKGGTYINIKDKKGNTPLHLAINSKYFEITKLLICFGASLTCINKSGISPFDLLQDAKIFDEPQMQQLFKLSKRETVNITSKNSKTFSKNLTKNIFYYCSKGKQKKVQQLIDKKGNHLVNAVSTHGLSPIYIGMKFFDFLTFYSKHHKNYVKFINYEIFLWNYKKLSKKNAILCKFEKKHQKHQKPLKLKYIFSKDSYNFLACKYGNLELLKYLHSSGPVGSLTIFNTPGTTPLHVSIEKKHVNVMNYLLENNAHFHIRDKNGKTALEIAVQMKNFEVVNILLKKYFEREEILRKEIEEEELKKSKLKELEKNKKKYEKKTSKPKKSMEVEEGEFQIEKLGKEERTRLGSNRFSTWIFFEF